MTTPQSVVVAAPVTRYPWFPQRCLNPASTTRIRLSGVIPSRQGREMGASSAPGRGGAAGAGLGASTSTSSPLAGGGGSSGDLEDFFGLGLGKASAASST